MCQKVKKARTEGLGRQAGRQAGRQGRDQCYVTMRPMYETTFAFAYEHVCMYSYVTCFYYNAAT